MMHRLTRYSIRSLLVLVTLACVVLVTDGVVESRHEDLDHGLARLLGRATELRDAPLPELVAALAELADPTLSDDVTVVAARLR